MMKRIKLSCFAFCAVLIFSINNAYSQAWLGKPITKKTDNRVDVKYGSLIKERRNDPAMQAFRDYGLGQYIHWGIYSMVGNEWNGAVNSGYSEWVRSWQGNNKPKDWESIYDNLYKQFNPKSFKPKEWAKQAKNMGVKYMIITTKHHDGFCLWPSEYSDYTVRETPYGKDILRDLVDAYVAEGIDIFFYFSIIDWHHKDYQAEIPTTKENVLRYENFKEFTRNQVFELLNKYPEVKGIWFDGSWDPAWVNQYKWSMQLEADIRELKPDMLIGSRMRNDEFGNRHFDANGDLIGDFEQGWERKLPANYGLLNGNDWDCIMTIPYNGWGYIKNWDTQVYIKTFHDLLKMMMQTVSMGGNFVLNFGPDKDGKMHPGEDKLANQFTEWMSVNSEAVYGVEHAKIEKVDYGYLTRNKDYLYLTVFNKPIDGLIRIPVDKNAKQVPQSAELLINKKQLAVKLTDIGLDLDKNYYYDILLPEKINSKDPFVIKIKMGVAQKTDNKLIDAKT